MIRSSSVFLHFCVSLVSFQNASTHNTQYRARDIETANKLNSQPACQQAEIRKCVSWVGAVVCCICVFAVIRVRVCVCVCIRHIFSNRKETKKKRNTPATTMLYITNPYFKFFFVLAALLGIHERTHTHTQPPHRYKTIQRDWEESDSKAFLPLQCFT